MSSDVNPSAPRAYDTSGRREQARVRRRSVLATAQRLFEAQGYAATTITGIAHEAAVSPEMIYKQWGTKAALLKDVFDVVIAGDDEPVAVPDRPEARLIDDEPDVREKLRLYATQAAPRAQRSAAIQLVIRNGAPTDPALAQLWERLCAERLVGMTMLAGHLAATGRLRVSAEAARDVLWTCIAIENYDLLVLQRTWSLTSYADWLFRTLTSNLLDP